MVKMEINREQHKKELPKIDLRKYQMACDYTEQDCHRLVAFQSVFNTLLLFNRGQETQGILYTKSLGAKAR